MLIPLVQTWLNEKLEKVQRLFEEKITGEILQCARKNLEDADALIGATEELMATLTHRLERLPE
jgi:hypothetical protein